MLPRTGTFVPVVRVRPSADSATHELRVTVRNSGRLPTALEQAKQVKIVRPDRLLLQGAQIRNAGRPPEFWLGGNETRTITIRVIAGDNARRTTVRLLSTRGGVAERAVDLPPG